MTQNTTSPFDTAANADATTKNFMNSPGWKMMTEINAKYGADYQKVFDDYNNFRVEEARRQRKTALKTLIVGSLIGIGLVVLFRE